MLSHAQRKRRSFLKATLALAAGGVLASCRPGFPGSDAPNPTAGMLLYVGTYADADTPGLYGYRLDAQRGGLTPVELKAQAGANPSFLAFHPNGRTLYAVNELEAGAVSAFALDPQSGALSLLNRQSTQGSAPCHLTTDRTGNFLLVANYSSGSLSVLRLRADGSIGEMVQVLQQRGQGANPARQDGPHAHFIGLAADNRFALHCDLGLDRVFVYAFDPASGQLTRSGAAALAPGAGPRHLAFGPDGRFVYVIDELDSTLAVFSYAAETGALTLAQTLSTLPEGFSGTNNAAEVCVHPTGKFVYGSNRGHDSIAIFAVEESTGRLNLLGHEATRGKTPRHFTIDRSGTYLLAANQDSNSIASFHIDPATGSLSPLDLIEVPRPVCLAFWPG